MRRQAWQSSLIIAGPPTGLTVLFATTSARQLPPDLTVIAVVAYLGALSVSIQAWLRLQERRGLEQQSKLRQEENHLELEPKNLERDQRSPSRDETDWRTSDTSEHLAPILTLRRKEKAGS
jgi:hypothetical protein